MHMSRIESRFTCTTWRQFCIPIGHGAKISHNYALLMKAVEI